MPTEGPASEDLLHDCTHTWKEQAKTENEQAQRRGFKLPTSARGWMTGFRRKTSVCPADTLPCDTAHLMGPPRTTVLPVGGECPLFSLCSTPARVILSLHFIISFPNSPSGLELLSILRDEESEVRGMTWATQLPMVSERARIQPRLRMSRPVILSNMQ